MLRILPRIFTLVIALAALNASDVAAQSLILNGYYDCQRATNGRAYCKRQDTNAYAPVSEEFFSQYEAARTGKPVTPVTNNSTTTTATVNNSVVIVLTGEASDIRGQILIMNKMLEEQKSLRVSSQGDAEAIDETIKAIEERIVELKSKFREKTTELSKYQSSIKPDDADQVITARRESEIQTKIPYYIPGTKETGEFWVEPYVSDAGELAFNFQFVDTASTSANKIRSTIKMNPDELTKVRESLLKAADNSRKAHAKGIRKEFQLRLTCFPMDECPPEGKKIEKKRSTEVIFKIYEDGSTGARIQINKGTFEEGYNISISSANLLQAYINHMILVGKTEHNAGSTDEEQLRQMFKE